MQLISKTSPSKWLVPWAIAIAMFMETLDSTIVGVAIPRIASSFQINPIDLKLAMTSYLLSLAIFIPISGWLADRFGARRVYLSAITIFTISSAFCGFSPNLTSLIISRFIQGLGAALMMPVGRLIVLKTFSKAEFARAINVVVVPALIGPAFGPTIGGLILGVTTWHWIFFVNIPIGVFGFCIAYWLVHSEKTNTTIPFNWIGFLLFGAGLSCITCGLAIIGEEFSLLKYAIILLFFAVILLVGYWQYSRRQTFPLLNLKLLKIKSLSVSITAGFINRVTTGAVWFLLPLLLQLVWHKSPLESGLLFMPMGIGMISAKLLYIRKWLRLYGFRRVLLINTSLLTIIMMSMCYFTEPRSIILLVCVIFAVGLLMSQQFTSFGTLNILEVDPKNFSQATSMASTMQQFSLGCGIAIAAILLHSMSYLFTQPLFSSKVFFWTILLLNTCNILTLPIINGLNPDLKLPAAKQNLEIVGHQKK